MQKEKIKTEFEDSMAELALECNLKKQIIIKLVEETFDALEESILAEGDYKIRCMFPKEQI